MSYLLNVFYALLLVAAMPWLALAAVRAGKYRRGLGEKFLGNVPHRAGIAPCLWLHAVSLGEVNLIAPLVAEWRRRHPDWQIAISTTTLTGHAAAKARYGEHAVFYAPLDFSWAARRAMTRIRPTLFVLAELELWPNLIAAAAGSGAKVAVINGRLSERSFRGYRRIRWLLRSTLALLDLVAAQSEIYAERFVALGVPRDRVQAPGSLKFDGARSDRANPETRRLAGLASFAAADVVFLAGSTQEPEERLALEAFRALAGEFPRLRLVIVPRHPERFEEVARLLVDSGVAWQRRSELERRPADADPMARVLLVDTVGELGAWWGTARIAYVGGSMGPREGQNMIEPAAFGAAVSFGPRTRNFRDVVGMLLDASAATVVPDGAELTTFVRRCLTEPDFASTLGHNARQVVAANQGATSRTADLLDNLIAAPCSATGRHAA